MSEDAGGGLTGVEYGAEMENGQGGHSGARDEVDLGLGDDAQGTLGSHHHTGQIDGAAVPIVQDKLVQVITADAALDLGVGAIDFVLLLAGDTENATIDLTLQSAGTEPGFQLGRRQLTQVGRGAVGQDYVKLFDVVESLAVDDGVGAAGVVADAAADAGAVGRCGIGGVLEAVAGNLAGELIEDDAGLHARPLFFRIDLDDVVEVLAEIEDDGVVDGLAGEAGAAGTGQDGDALAGTEFHDGLDIGGVTRDHDAHGFHLVDAGVGAVQQT